MTLDEVQTAEEAEAVRCESSGEPIPVPCLSYDDE
jgi:hypothetical protein